MQVQYTIIIIFIEQHFTHIFLSTLLGTMQQIILPVPFSWIRKNLGLAVINIATKQLSILAKPDACNLAVLYSALKRNASQGFLDDWILGYQDF